MTIYSDLIEINTYILQKDSLILIEDLDCMVLADPGRVLGSITISANGRHLTTKEYLTDVVQAWAQMSNVLYEIVLQKKTYVQSSFPGIDMTMYFAAKGDGLALRVDTAAGKNFLSQEVMLNHRMAIDRIYQACRCFFLKIKHLNPDSPYDQEIPLKFLDKLAPLIKPAS